MSARPETLQSLSRILRALLGDESINLEMDTRREDVPGWDSFNYVNFIVGVESEFGVKFKVADVESFPNVGAVVEKIEQLTAGAAGRKR
jgi:acyl carrier protein